MKTLAILFAATVVSASLATAQNYYYGGVDATGRLTRTAVTNVSQAASGFRAMRLLAAPAKQSKTERLPKIVEPQPRQLRTLMMRSLAAASPIAAGLTVNPASTAFNFLGLTHYDQRNANNGNQYSSEPPSPDIAASASWILEGVNNAIQVYDTAGNAKLPKTLSTNELFAVPAAIDWATGANGVYPTDMRVFYDHDMDRWFVLQRAQDYDYFGNPINSSKLYLAVSQSNDPTATYTIYTMDTTNPMRPGCPCFSDFPSIGADKYGIYISSDEYSTAGGTFVDVSILAISKKALLAKADSPRMIEFVVYRATGYEATIRPAMTPPGSSYGLGYGGVEFFLSTNSYNSSDNRFGLWAMTNTASLDTTPNLTLIQTVIPGMAYTYPDVAIQKAGPLPYGSTLIPPGLLAFIHGGRDSRMLSLVYSSGRLFAAFATQAMDQTGRSLVAGAWAVLYPTLRNTTLAAPVWKSGYLLVDGEHVLRPSIGVTALGKGAIAFTLVGPNYYPSAAFVPINGFTVGTTAQIAAPGFGPEDGFSGYPDLGFSTTGIARWGDYSGAVAANDGSIWMTMEYIPDAPRTTLANWGTRVVRHVP